MYSETKLNAQLLKGEMSHAVTYQNNKCELVPEPFLYNLFTSYLTGTC